MLENRQKVMKYMGSTLRASYIVPGPSASHGGPFSYKMYLSKLLNPRFWGNGVVIWSVSMMWGLKIQWLTQRPCRNTNSDMVWPSNTLQMMSQGFGLLYSVLIDREGLLSSHFLASCNWKPKQYMYFWQCFQVTWLLAHNLI